jgi:hypothetical protein
MQEENKSSTPVQSKWSKGRIKVTDFLNGGSSSKMNHFLFWLKEMMNDIEIKSGIMEFLNTFISSFGFIYSFYDKYNRIWDSLKFTWVSESVGGSDLLKKQALTTLKKLGWMIFIIAKLTILRNKLEIPDWAWMLMATMYILIVNLDKSEVSCTILENSDSESEFKTAVFEKLCKIFVANETEPVRFSIDLISKMLEKYKSMNIVQIKGKSSKLLKMDADMEVEEEKHEVKLDKNDPNSINVEHIKGMFDFINAKNNFQHLYKEYEK